ncbi:FAD-dependent oxidoreductase [Mycolicibacterium thermoresistibile]
MTDSRGSDASVSGIDAATIERCDVCVVGAGIAGLNALFVASRYLTGDQRIILIDRRERVGGMWVDTYPYVRLHQPHPFFTAGNIKWTLGRNRSYLPTKTEVLDHLSHCLEVIENRVHLDEFFGWDMTSCTETDGAVQINCTAPDGRQLTVRADRLIKAYGLRVTPNDPLQLSSSRVTSVSPDFCAADGDELWSSDAPVWIIGGGKTAMDTAHTIITECPGREVNLVAGSGTFFVTRERFLPAGTRRWLRHTLMSNMAREMGHRFDGTNETAVAEWFRTTYGICVTPEAGNFLLGVLSDAEKSTIAAGLNDVVMGHLVDAVDRNGGTELVFRSGATKTIAPGSFLVNCTGYVFRDHQPYEPYVDDSGAVLSIQPRSATMHLSSFTAYFLTHLLLSGKIKEIPLYEVDLAELWGKSHAVTPYTMFSLAQYNLSLIADAVPTKVFRDCGLDFDRWYPLPHRLAGTARFMLTHHGERDHQRRALDTVRDRFGVRCGPLIPQ